MHTQKNARGMSAGAVVSMDMPEPARADRSPRFASPQALQQWFERRIVRELDRCRACMSEAEWIECRGFVEEHARACLREVIEQRAMQGAL